MSVHVVNKIKSKNKELSSPLWENFVVFFSNIKVQHGSLPVLRPNSMCMAIVVSFCWPLQSIYRISWFHEIRTCMNGKWEGCLCLGSYGIDLYTSRVWGWPLLCSSFLAKLNRFKIYFAEENPIYDLYCFI